MHSEEDAYCISLLIPFYLLGKAHGSLARAGKVRGQTPKVGAGVSADGRRHV